MTMTDEQLDEALDAHCAKAWKQYNSGTCTDACRGIWAHNTSCPNCVVTINDDIWDWETPEQVAHHMAQDIAHGCFGAAIVALRDELAEDIAPDSWVFDDTWVNLEQELYCHDWADEHFQDFIEDCEAMFDDFDIPYDNDCY